MNGGGIHLSQENRTTSVASSANHSTLSGANYAKFNSKERAEGGGEASGTPSAASGSGGPNKGGKWDAQGLQGGVGKWEGQGEGGNSADNYKGDASTPSGKKDNKGKGKKGNKKEDGGSFDESKADSKQKGGG